MPAAPPVEQLRAAGARQPNDMFDVWETSRDRPHSGRITRAAPCSKKTYEQQTAADLEPPVMDVLMRDAITREVRREPYERNERERDPEREDDLAQDERPRGVDAEADDDERRRHRHEPADDDRDPPPDEPLHHDLSGQSADRRAREAREEEREGEELARRGAEQRHERLVRDFERLDVMQAALEERAGSHH